MNVAIRTTVSDLIRVLRGRAHDMAEDAATGYRRDARRESAPQEGPDDQRSA